MGDSSVCVQTLVFHFKGLWLGILTQLCCMEMCVYKFRLMCGAQIAWKVRNNSRTVFVGKHWCNNSDSYPGPWKLLLLAFIVNNNNIIVVVQHLCFMKWKYKQWICAVEFWFWNYFTTDAEWLREGWFSSQGVYKGVNVFFFMKHRPVQAQAGSWWWL